jgi:hypothetical protein
VAEIFTVSSKVFSRDAGVVAITTKSHFVNDLQSSLAKCSVFPTVDLIKGINLLTWELNCPW